MAHSPLATISVPAYEGNYTKGRSAKIRCVTVHHMAGVNSVEGCGRIFQAVGRNGSSHYGIGNDGRIGYYVEEENTAWTNSNWASNCESVTIETSNSSLGGDYPVSDAAFNSLIKLVADIAKRNNLGKLVPGDNLTWHSMFVATSCPGNYLRARMQFIADEANRINEVKVEEPAPEPEAPVVPEKPAVVNGFSVGDKVSPKEFKDYNGTRLLKTREFYFIGSISGNRAVLRADSVDGPIYAAMNTDNLNKIEGAPATENKPETPGFSVGDKVIPKTYVDMNGTHLAKTRSFYYISNLNGKRAVLRADSVNGEVYAAVSTDNLEKIGGTSAPAPAAPADNSIKVGDKVVLKTWKDYNGTPLVKTRNFYFVSQINGDRAVLRADSVNGAVYAAAKVENLQKA